MAAIGFKVGGGRVLGGGESEETTAYQVPADTIGNQQFGGALGMDFIVLEPTLVTELGVFDSGGNGLSSTLTAQIWQRNDQGTPGNDADDTGDGVLASLAFPPGSPGTLEGGSRFKALTSPIILAPGTYTMVGYGHSASDPNGNLGLASAGEWETDGGESTLQFSGKGRYGAAGTFPATPDGGPPNRYAAGTFKFLPQGASEILTDVEAEMHATGDTLLERIAFDIAELAAIDSLQFEIGYDDGFIAWINGIEIARRNVPTISADNATLTLPIALTPGTLTNGTNLLAIEGRNLNASDEDFILRPALRSVETESESLRYFTTPTPGAPNDAGGILGFVGDTQFSIDRGFYDAPFDVEIVSFTPAAEIYFTTDGSEPSAENGTLYSTPIAINTTTVLRARAFLEGFEPTDVDTMTYLFPADVATQGDSPPGYPLSWSTVAADYGMDSNQNDYARAAGDPSFSRVEAEAAIANSLRALPSLSIATDLDNLFDPTNGIYVNPGARGQAWERPVSIELINPDGSPGFQENAGIRMMGFSSRNVDIRKLHMRLLFKKQYGPGTLNFPLFGEDRADKINTFALRGNWRDSFLFVSNPAYIGDEWAKRTQSDMGQPAVRGTFVHLYINGLYWGVYNPTERPDDTFGENYFGGDRADYDVIKFCCPDRSINGDSQMWDMLLNEARAGMSSDAAYQRVQGNNPDGTPNPAFPVLLDVDNLIDYLINGQYHGAWDWPGNYYTMRDRIDGRSPGFRFFTWDNDVIFDGGTPTVANKVQPDPGHNWWTESPGEVDIGIRQNAEYRLRFADRVYQHFFHDGALTEEANIDRWNELGSLVRPALFAESARWGDARAAIKTVQDDWDPMNSRMLNNYFPARQAIVFDQLRANNLYPDIDPPEFNRRGGIVSPGFRLAFISGENIYYTLDGSDPRLAGGVINPSAATASSSLGEVVLVEADAPALAQVPANGDDALNWTAPGFDDASWLSGTSGVGYEFGNGYQPLIGVDLIDDMRGVSETAYVRIPFSGVNASEFRELTLQMRYDDGFVAYLNGVEIASANSPATLDWQSGAASSHEASLTEFVDFDVSGFIDELLPDGNVLAIHGLNRGDSGPDFIIQPRLKGLSTAGGDSVALGETVQVKARVLEDGEWSALNQVSFVVGIPADASNLIISELFYNPPGPEEAAEFVELLNTSDVPIDLSGVAFTAGITFEFPLGTILPAAGRLLIAKDLTATPSAIGTYEGSLANGGETLTLIAADGSVIVSFTFDDKAPWPEAADGDGYSLVFVRGEPNEAGSWRSSVSAGGSPGDSDSITYQGGDPLAYAMSGQAPTVTLDGAQWSIQFDRFLAADDATVSAEISTDLGTWTPAGQPSAVSQPDPNGVVIQTISGTRGTPQEQLFIRVRIEILAQ